MIGSLFFTDWSKMNNLIEAILSAKMTASLGSIILGKIKKILGTSYKSRFNTGFKIGFIG